MAIDDECTTASQGEQLPYVFGVQGRDGDDGSPATDPLAAPTAQLLQAGSSVVEAACRFIAIGQLVIPLGAKEPFKRGLHSLPLSFETPPSTSLPLLGVQTETDGDTRWRSDAKLSLRRVRRRRVIDINGTRSVW